MDNADKEIYEFELSHCTFCRKSLQGKVKILAEVVEPKDSSLIFCVPCMQIKQNPFRISYYRVCQPSKGTQDIYNKILAEGIEQFLNPQDQQGQAQVEMFEKLNEEVFDDNLNINEPMPDYVQMKREAPDSHNKKYLKAMGYSWDRSEFGFLPEGVFGQLMGVLEESDSENEELVDTVLKYYQQERQAQDKVGEYLKNSRFLQGSKGFSRSQDIPDDYHKLRKFEKRAKQIVAQVNMLLESEQEEENKAKYEDIMVDENRERSAERKKTAKKAKKSGKSVTGRRGEPNHQLVKIKFEKLEDKKEDLKDKASTQDSPQTPSIRRRGRPRGSTNRIFSPSNFNREVSSGSKVICKMQMGKKEHLIIKRQRKLKETQPSKIPSNN